jgi:hypothetical protein
MKKENPMPPFTLEEAEKWIGQIEDQANDARDTAIAMQYIVVNLLIRLGKQEAVDVRQLMADLLSGSELLETDIVKTCVREISADVLSALDANETAGRIH